MLISSLRRTSDYPVGAKLGLELEMEGSKFPPVRIPYWSAHNDNSLRDYHGAAREFVSEPLSSVTMKTALSFLGQAAKDHKSTAVPSIRTSTHVHLNVSDLDIVDMASIICVYAIFEPAFYKMTGEHRYGNCFCVPLREAQGFIDDLKAFFRTPNDRSLSNLTRENYKYMAVSTFRLYNLGTLEFRIHEGLEFNNLDRAAKWCDILTCIRQYALSIPNPVSIVQQFSEVGFSGLARQVFGDLADELNLDLPSVVVYDGLDVAQEIAYSVSWKDKSVTNKQETPDPVYTYEKPSARKKNSYTVEPQRATLDLAALLGNAAALDRRPRQPVEPAGRYSPIKYTAEGNYTKVISDSSSRRLQRAVIGAGVGVGVNPTKIFIERDGSLNSNGTTVVGTVVVKIDPDTLEIMPLAEGESVYVISSTAMQHEWAYFSNTRDTRPLVAYNFANGTYKILVSSGTCPPTVRTATFSLPALAGRPSLSLYVPVVELENLETLADIRHNWSDRTLSPSVLNITHEEIRRGVLPCVVFHAEKEKVVLATNLMFEEDIQRQTLEFFLEDYVRDNFVEEDED